LPFFPERLALFFGKIVPLETVLDGTSFFFALYLLNRNSTTTFLLLLLLLLFIAAMVIFGSGGIGPGILMECPLSFRHCPFVNLLSTLSALGFVVL
jgi:hypothetical protein